MPLEIKVTEPITKKVHQHDIIADGWIVDIKYTPKKEK